MLSKEQLEVISKLGDGGYLNYLSDGSFAEMATELLSLREQLAELKAVQPIAEMRTWPKNISGPNPDWFWFGKQDFPVGTQLFTAAKPAGLDVEDITEFMRKAFWRGFESARGTENSNIPEHWKDSKPNLLLALKAKISGA
ncbi:hypothetical protein ACSOQ1_000825 [Yersinia enterocolitica]